MFHEVRLKHRVRFFSHDAGHIAGILGKEKASAADLVEVGPGLGLEPRSDDRLAPGATAEDVLAAVEGAGETVVVVGHQPDCSEIAEALGAGGQDFAPGAFVEIELP